MRLNKASLYLTLTHPKVGLAQALLDAERSDVFLLVEANLVREVSEVEGALQKLNDDTFLTFNSKIYAVIVV